MYLHDLCTHLMIYFLFKQTKGEFSTARLLKHARLLAQWPAPPRKNCCRKYPELSNLHKIWNIVHNVNNHIEEKLGSEMFR